MTNLNQGARESSICRSCGFCCDGTLFYYTPTEKDQKDNQDDTNPSVCNELPQPCKHFCNQVGCQIYPSRPDVCRGFECDLLESVKESRTTLAEALQIVEKLKKLRIRLLDAIADADSGPGPLPLQKRCMQFYCKHKNSARGILGGNADFYMDYVSFVYLIRKHILSDFDKDEPEEEGSTAVVDLDQKTQNPS